MAGRAGPARRRRARSPTPTPPSARALREALRALLRANAGGDPDPAATVLVNGLAARAPLRLELDAAAKRHCTRPGARASTRPSPASWRRSTPRMVDGTWARFKVCLDPGCEWAFYDRSRNRSSHWCDMAACGSRHKVRAYRARRHTPSQ